MKELIDRLEREGVLGRQELVTLIENFDDETRTYAAERARAWSLGVFGNKIYLRGLIEITNYCKNDCYYCGIRHSNANVCRYRLSLDEILSCCKEGYRLGFRTFVLQGGEDPFFKDDVMVKIVKTIRAAYPDCAITLSVGEKSYETYRRFHEAGADRYLLREESADETHFGRLHPTALSGAARKQCLRNLKELGFQAGGGFMVGAPYQTADHIAQDLLFLHELQPQMVGIGPFVPHHDTCFRDNPAGSLELSLFLLSLIRLMLKNTLLPATTALGTIKEGGREMGILAGANVIMPNLSPDDARENYNLYDNKPCFDKSAADILEELKASLRAIGYEAVVDRGDYKQLNFI